MGGKTSKESVTFRLLKTGKRTLLLVRSSAKDKYLLKENSNSGGVSMVIALRH